jgi:hypothetical protein|tara:strand:+ start:1773 stop:2231 length:459 start_codon:yes stop_codon:yes gene_type:complete
MPKYTEQQIREREEKVAQEMEQAEKEAAAQDEAYAQLLLDQQAKSDNPSDGYYIQVLGDDEYGTQMGTTKKDDSYELIIPFVGQVTKGYELYIARNDAGVLEQRIREADLDYSGKRRNEYPKLAEQLDMIYHDIDAWRETIREIKERNPKGE